jgi:hypothetical protein
LLGVLVIAGYVAAGTQLCPADTTTVHTWGWKLFCDAKLSDIALVLFSYSLVIVTRDLVVATKEIFGHTKEVERAYVTAGFGGWDQTTGTLFANINNYGKTQGFVTEIAIAVAPLAALNPAKAHYPTTAPQRAAPAYYIEPMLRGLRAGHVSVLWAGQPGHVFYGRVWFDDIFGTKHCSSFALKLGAPNAAGAIPCEALDVAAYPDYWHWE